MTHRGPPGLASGVILAKIDRFIHEQLSQLFGSHAVQCYVLDVPLVPIKLDGVIHFLL